MIIKIHTKNRAQKTELEIETPQVPRVGEIIYFKSKFDGEAVSHLVCDVSYELENQSLTPIIFCMAADPVDRKFRLQENGWL